MEVVVAVSKRKLASIHVIGMEQYPFENVLGREIGAGLKHFHESQGIVFHSSTSVKAIRKEPGDALTKVELSDGEILSADFIVMGVGVRPATDYLKESDWELEKDGSVKVDELLQVPGRANVYAIGDIATYPQLPQGTYRRIEHWNVRTGACFLTKPCRSHADSVRLPEIWVARSAKRSQNLRSHS
jgi:NAD(P)H-nitrite reductase large subunit